MCSMNKARGMCEGKLIQEGTLAEPLSDYNFNNI